MANFLELIAALSEAGGDYPETMFDDLLAAYEEDMSVPAAKIGELESSLTDAALAAEAQAAESAATIAALKAQNYDLLMSVDASGNAGGGAGDEEVERNDDEDDEILTPESLFETE